MYLQVKITFYSYSILLSVILCNRAHCVYSKLLGRIGVCFEPWNSDTKNVKCARSQVPHSLCQFIIENYSGSIIGSCWENFPNFICLNLLAFFFLCFFRTVQCLFFFLQLKVLLFLEYGIQNSANCLHSSLEYRFCCVFVLHSDF